MAVSFPCRKLIVHKNINNHCLVVCRSRALPCPARVMSRVNSELMALQPRWKFVPLIVCNYINWTLYPIVPIVMSTRGVSSKNVSEHMYRILAPAQS
jgi:hypothetical protein